MTQVVGIERMNVYSGKVFIGVSELLTGRGLDVSRIENLGMVERSIALPFEDPVTNAVNAARPILDSMPESERSRIECLLVTTESGLDLSKSVSSYVHQYLGLSRNCRVLEVKQACYSATGSLQLIAGMLASGMAGDSKALLIGTDVSLVDERAQYAEACTGHGAVAMLIGVDNPAILAMDPGAYGNYGYEAMDSARPTPSFDIAQPDESLFTYLDCLEHSFADYCTRVEGVDVRSTFGQFSFHTPFGGLVKAGHRNLMRSAGASADEIEIDFERRLGPALAYPIRTGNLCSASVYLGLASVIENVDLTEPTRFGLYSYGSGCCSEFFSGVVSPEASDCLPGSIAEALESRRRLEWPEYGRLLEANRAVLQPAEKHCVDLSDADLIGGTDDRPPFLAWTGTASYQRQYSWL